MTITLMANEARLEWRSLFDDQELISESHQIGEKVAQSGHSCIIASKYYPRKQEC